MDEILGEVLSPAYYIKQMNFVQGEHKCGYCKLSMHECKQLCKVINKNLNEAQTLLTFCPAFTISTRLLKPGEKVIYYK